MLRVTKNKKGISLIEVIIVLAIMSLVLSVTFSMFIFGNNTYNKGNQQYDIQSDVRIASDYIQRQIRYATFVNLIDVPTDYDEYENFDEDDPVESEYLRSQLEYIFFNDDGKLIHMMWNEGDGKHNYVRYSTSFPLPNSRFDSDGQNLIMTVNADKKEQNYEIISNIVLPNMQLLGATIPSNGHKAIVFSRDVNLMAYNNIFGGDGDDDDGNTGDDGDVFKITGIHPEYNSDENVGLIVSFVPVGITITSLPSGVKADQINYTIEDNLIVITFDKDVSHNSTLELDITIELEDNVSYRLHYDKNEHWTYSMID